MLGSVIAVCGSSSGCGVRGPAFSVIDVQALTELHLITLGYMRAMSVLDPAGR